jgi:hypothetical protein
MKSLTLLAQTYQAEGEFKRAAQALSSFKFEQFRTLQVTPAEKLAWHVDTAVLTQPNPPSLSPSPLTRLVLSCHSSPSFAFACSHALC